MNNPFEESEIQLIPGKPMSQEYFRILNNFHWFFPVGNEPYDPAEEGVTEESPFSVLSKNHGKWDIRHEDTAAAEEEGHSRLWMLQTDAEFCSQAQNAAAALGYNPKDLSNTVNRVCFGPMHGEDQETIFRGAFFALVPIYRKLRQMGYSQRDLTL